MMYINRDWEQTAEEIAAAYNLSPAQVEEALAFYSVHAEEIDRALAVERALEAENV